MGKILYLTCNKNEEHEYRFFVGIGMMFPSVYEKIIKQIKKGKYGAEIKNFLQENPKGAINCESEVAYCPKCGKLEEVVNLSMYIPKKNNQNIDVSYVMPSELQTEYKRVKEYKHICPKCSSEMKIIKSKKAEIKCPLCDGVLKINDGGCWD